MQYTRKSSRLDEFIENPRRGLWSLAIPMMLGMMVQTVYLLVDMIFVGKVSASALTALAFNMPLIFLGLGLTFGLGTGVTAVIAQFIGANEKRNADNSAEHAVVLGIIIGLIFMVAGWNWGRELFTLLGVPSDILELAWDYFKVMCGGYVFVVSSIFFRSILSGEGDMKTPMYIQGGGTILNIILDPIFIFGLNMGVMGAAVATVLSNVIVALIFIYLLFIKEHSYIKFALKDFKYSGEILGKIFKVGIPASFSMVIMSFGGGVFNKILIGFSSDAVAVYQVGGRVDHIYFVPAISISSAVITMVGMFYGAKRFELIRKVIYYGMSRSAYIGIAIGAVFYLFAPDVFSVFSDDTGIINNGTQYLRIIVFSYPFISISMTCGRTLQGLGFGMPMLVITFLRVLLVSVLLSYVFVFWMHKPVEWVWIAMLISVIVSAIVGSIWLRIGLRKVTSA